MDKNNWKKRDGIVYSTNSNFEYEYEKEQEQETLPPQEQNLQISLDKKARKGKIVTLVRGFVGTSEDLNQLAKYLKSKCGVGGSSKDGEILIQGNNIEKIGILLTQKKYNIKISGK